MKRWDDKEKRWFTAVDALIVVVVLSLVISAVVLFLFPKGEEDTVERATVMLELYCDKEPVGVKVDDTVYLGEEAVGTVEFVDMDANKVVAGIEMELDGNTYTFNGKPVRINGGFTLETRLCRMEGVVCDINIKEGR